MASNGIILNNYYVSPICSPSRSALLTGIHPIHSGMQHNVIGHAEPWGVPLKYKMLPQHLKELGYKTLAVGKWHQGFYKKAYIPTERGFDYHFGYWTGAVNYFDRTSLESCWGIDFRENENVANLSQYQGQYSTEIYTKKAVDLILNHKQDKPLFLYLAHQAVHKGNIYKPLEAPDKYVDKFKSIKNLKRRTFAGMISALDDSVGEVVQAFNRAKILNDTIIIFTTDNGGRSGYNNKGIEDMGSNWPLKGGKTTLWEGGIRGNGFLWSSKLTNRYISQHLIHIQDLMPTIYKAVGGNVSHLGSIDGIDHWDALNNNKSPLRDELLHNIDDIWKVWAIRKGDYKLINGSVFNRSLDKWFKPPGFDDHSNQTIETDSIVSKVLKQLPNYKYNSLRKVIVNCTETQTPCNPIKAPCLFNIKLDPCEMNNLADKMPELTQQLISLMKKYNETAVPPLNVPMDKLANPALHNYLWDIWRDND